ncbi:uncharacterized protein ISCGN_028841 [Ixodes scapularis]
MAEGLRLVAAISLKLGCNVELLDKCGADLVIFGTGPKVPENTKDLLAQCEVEFAAGVCARQFANRCLPPLPRGMVVVILEGISQEVSSKCNVTNPLHNEFLKYASCMNKVGDALHKCMKKLTLSLDYSASIEPHLRVGRSCCPDIVKGNAPTKSNGGNGNEDVSSGWWQTPPMKIVHKTPSAWGKPDKTTNVAGRRTHHKDAGLRLVAAISLKLGCNVELLDKCGADLVIFGTGPKVPENTKDLLAQCEVEFAAGVCARQFANRCLPPLPRGMVVVILEGISQEVSSKCNVTNPLHNEFLKYASCMNKVGDALHKCMKKLTLSLDYSASIEPHLRVGRSCCNFAEYLTCSGDAMKKECGEEAEEYLKKLLTRSAGDFIEIACINHRTDFESCKSSANVVDMSTTRITSLLSPMAKLVSAEG